MKITLAWLKKHNACAEGMEYCERKGLIGLPADQFAEKLVEGNKLSWANWLIAHALQKLDKVRYAVYAAEQVLPIFDKKYPGDDRPKNAIAAAKAYIENPCADTAHAAHADAYADAYDAVFATYTPHAYAADTAAYAAAYAADAAHATTYATDAADATTYAADAAAHAHAGIYEKVLRYGINLLKNENHKGMVYRRVIRKTIMELCSMV